MRPQSRALQWLKDILGCFRKVWQSFRVIVLCCTKNILRSRNANHVRFRVALGIKLQISEFLDDRLENHFKMTAEVAAIELSVTRVFIGARGGTFCLIVRSVKNPAFSAYRPAERGKDGRRVFDLRYALSKPGALGASSNTLKCYKRGTLRLNTVQIGCRRFVNLERVS